MRECEPTIFFIPWFLEGSVLTACKPKMVLKFNLVKIGKILRQERASFRRAVIFINLQFQ